LTIWSSCLWPVTVRGEDLAVAPPTMSGSARSNACPARPRRVPACHIMVPAGSALYCVPSDGCACADVAGPHSTPASGAAYLIKNGAEPLIGPTEACLRALVGPYLGSRGPIGRRGCIEQ
jgi:hypothetical protein